MVNINVDIDGTICETAGLDYTDAVPIPERIKRVNQLYGEGNTVVYTRHVLPQPILCQGAADCRQTLFKLFLPPAARLGPFKWGQVKDCIGSGLTNEQLGALAGSSGGRDNLCKQLLSN